MVSGPVVLEEMAKLAPTTGELASAPVQLLQAVDLEHLQTAEH